MRDKIALILVASVVLSPRSTSGQSNAGAADSVVRPGMKVDLAAEATFAVTALNGRPFGGSLTEGYLTRPIVVGRLVWPREVLLIQLELNFEGLTLRRGELNPAIFGEGYFDRRHPHTLLHDVMLTIQLPSTSGTPVRASMSAGRGFAPFGTDDPMSRPFLKFPANHHLAQVLERVVIIGAASVKIGPTSGVSLEAGTYNGDDPVGPFAAPQWRRVGDSWSGRLTVTSQQRTGSIELQASYAKIASPDIPLGGGLDQRKRSASVRVDFSGARTRPYVLVEYARSESYSRVARAFEYSSWLAEGSMRARWFELSLRAEQSDRPEDVRQPDPFRSPRPPDDLLHLGITRWRVMSGRIGHINSAFIRFVPTALTPFVEGSVAMPRALIENSALDPRTFYGRRRLSTLSFGARVGVGSGSHGRMGRYGAATGVVAATLSHHAEQ